MVIQGIILLEPRDGTYKGIAELLHSSHLKKIVEDVGYWPVSIQARVASPLLHFFFALWGAWSVCFFRSFIRVVK
jgi:hypothetical protein